MPPPHVKSGSSLAFSHFILLFFFCFIITNFSGCVKCFIHTLTQISKFTPFTKKFFPLLLGEGRILNKLASS